MDEFRKDFLKQLEETRKEFHREREISSKQLELERAENQQQQRPRWMRVWLNTLAYIPH